MNKILEILQTVRPEENFASSNDFINDGLLDSFDIVTLVTELDEAFSVSIDGMDIVPENFRNIDAIKSLLLKKGVKL
jgi:methoxymalonate biosynthesis acyl carrier protein